MSVAADRRFAVRARAGSVSGLVKVLIANLDDDSFGDLVTANQATQNISVMINATTSCP
ncbi:MAG: hypothetical protein KJ057_16890 [Phycisphaerae bacterium]|nr:hypothetical protein [Planctomycetia bacterium]MCL4720142.1 hypothetical protein [Phycisphaerae bacterium]NUQ10530.1 hypothetical protein [Phycisphaerae bacterium]